MTPEQSFFDACRAGDFVQVRRMLDADPRMVNARDLSNATALIEAARTVDSVAVVELLLQHGADPLHVHSAGRTALHEVVSGAVAELLVAATGVAGLGARAGLERTPLHEAVEMGRVDVVTVLLAAGADCDATAIRSYSQPSPVTPLNLATEPAIVRLLLAAGASVHTPQARTPLHQACERAAQQDIWVPVVDLLLYYGADPGRRDEFGENALDALGAAGPTVLREKMTAMLHETGRSPELELAEVAGGAQTGIAIHPWRAEAVTSMYCGAVLVIWRLEPTIEPVRVVRLSERVTTAGPYGSAISEKLAFNTRTSVHLRDWRTLQVAEEVPANLIPASPGLDIALARDGRFLAVAGSEELIVVDIVEMVRHDVPEDGDHRYFGDWATVPQFSPDGSRLGVGNTMQGSWWHTMLTVAHNGTLTYGFDSEPPGIADLGAPKMAGALAFTPDGRRVASWIYPEFAHPCTSNRGLVVVVDSVTGDALWHRLIDDDIAGAPGTAYFAPLCFTLDGAWLAIGLDTGIVWLDAETGTATIRQATNGAVRALATAPHVGILAATDFGILRAQPPRE